MSTRFLAAPLLLALAACATGRPSSREPSRILPRPVEAVRQAVVETLVANGLEVQEGPGWIDGHLAGSLERRPVSLRVWTAPAGQGRTALWVDQASDGAFAPTAGGAGFVGQGVAARLRREGEAGWDDAPAPAPEDPRRTRFAAMGGVNAPLSTAARGRGTMVLTADVVDGQVAVGGLLQAGVRLGSAAGWRTGSWVGPVLRLRLTPRPAGVSLDVGMQAVF